ncbi:MAG: bifunctional nuclease family protein [Muribaculaceae bacterium]|nr:bifunctional nuclease family protein [Muribaculaceae bacterium]
MESNNNESLIQLRILGMTTSNRHEGASILILAEVEGIKRIPVVVGPAEAQSIGIWLEHITTPRPLTHDLFVNYIRMNNAIVRNIVIYKFDNGVFFSKICIATANHDKDIYLDSRTSDAIAIAIRTNAPIFAYKSVVDSSSFAFSEISNDEEAPAIDVDKAILPTKPIKQIALKELELKLERLIKNEEYEQAAELKKTIDKFRNSGQ